MAGDGQFRKRIEQLEGLLGEVEALPDAARDRTSQIVQSLLELHGEALARVMEHLSQAGEAGRPILDAISGDELISSVLLIHDLHPLDLEARVRQALEKVRPFLALHHGSVELLGITADGVINLRLEGSCHGCPSSRVTLKSTIEEALLAAAPEITAIEVEGLAAQPEPVAAGFVPVSQLSSSVGSAYPNGCEIPAL